ncbi:MAG: site-specific integrase [Candidatus Acidiferrales bacterium]
MSIFKRGNVYWYHFMFNGEHVQRSTKQGNPRTARQIEAAFRTALAKGEVGITERKKAPGFKAAMRSFLAWSEREHEQHPATHCRYLVSSAALLRHFEDQPLDRITPDDVERFKAARAMEYKTVRGKAKDSRKRTGKRIMPATVNRELACLKALFNHAIKSDLPVRNPVSRVEFLAERNEQTRVLSFDEQARYLGVATPMLRDIATLMLETGMRPEEVYRIQPENVNLAGGFLFNPCGKTKAARRRVPLTARARSVLTRRMAGLETSFLFPCDTDSARPVPKVNHAHDRAVKASKVAPFRLYDLRHTWATRAAESGIDLVTLAALLGHSKIQMVLRYAHPTQEHQARSVERMEQFVAARQMEELLVKQGTAEGMIQ